MAMNGLESAQETIDSLSTVLEQIKAGEEGDFDVASLPALLAKLDQASNAADGIESRLDDLIGELDSLLEGLEKQQETVQGQEPVQAQNDSEVR